MGKHIITTRIEHHAVLNTCKYLEKHRVLFHTDAVQAMGHIQIDVEKMNIDMLSASAHKLNGPKGVGLMYIRKGIAIPSFIHGGAQERGRRAGSSLRFTLSEQNTRDDVDYTIDIIKKLYLHMM